TVSMNSVVNLTGLVTNTDYILRLYTSSSATHTLGNYRLALRVPPVNNDCDGATALTINVPASGSTVGATQTIAASPCGGNANDDVWYSFVAPAYPVDIIVVGNSGFDAVVNLRSGACNGTSMVCRDNTGNGGTEIITASDL